MGKLKICIDCKNLKEIHGHGRCSPCYYKWYNQKSEVKRRKNEWNKRAYRNNPELRERIKQCTKRHNKEYQKTEKYKQAKRCYDKRTWSARKYEGNRDIVLKRDDYKCRWCKSTKNICVHHEDENRRNNSMDNLITLCAKCHVGFHQEKAWHKKIAKHFQGLSLPPLG